MKTYSIINIADLNLIDFSQVFEGSETIRKNIDETQFVIKYNTEPTFISDGTVTPIQTLNHSDCIALMHTVEWQNEDEL